MNFKEKDNKDLEKDNPISDKKTKIDEKEEKKDPKKTIKPMRKDVKKIINTDKLKIKVDQCISFIYRRDNIKEKYSLKKNEWIEVRKDVYEYIKDKFLHLKVIKGK